MTCPRRAQTKSWARSWRRSPVATMTRVPQLVRDGLDAGLPPDVILDDGLVAGIREVGEMFRRGEAYLPEMMLAAEAWQAGMDVLEPLMAGRAARRGRRARSSSAPSRATSTPSARTSSPRC